VVLLDTVLGGDYACFMEQTNIEREQWLRERKGGLGGTDVASIICASADRDMKVGCFGKSLFALWSNKMRNEIEQQSDNPAMKRGRVMEKYVSELYAENKPGIEVKECGLVWHKDTKHIFGTPDRIIIGEDITWGLEIKTRRSRDGWGESGTGLVPLDVEVQCRVYMEVTDMPYWDVAVLIGMDDYREYRIERDEELGQQILKTSLAWWDKHVAGNVPPSPDGSAMAKEALASMHPRVKVEELRTPTGDEIESHSRLVEVRRTIKALTDEKNEIENKLRAAIGDDAGIKGIASWKQNKSSMRFDQKKFEQDHPDLYKSYLSEREGARVFRVLGAKS